MRTTAVVCVVLALFVAAVSAAHPAIESGEWRRHDLLSSKLKTSKADTTHRVWVSLKQRNLEALERAFWSVSNPKSSDYGRFYSQKQIAELVAPAPVVIDQITQWLTSGAGGCTPDQLDWVVSRDAVHVTLSVEQAEALFGVTMHVYEQHPELAPASGIPRVLVRSSTAPVLPAHIREHVTLIHGISDFPPVSKRSAARRKARKHNALNAARSGAVKLTPGVPTIMRARGREGAIQIWYAPTCGNGLQSANVLPCSDDHTSGWGTQSTVVLTASTTINPTPATYTSSKLTPDQCAIESGITVCHVQLTVPWYDAYTVSIAVGFSNPSFGTFSATNANVVANIPPVTPQVLWRQYGLGENPRVSTGTTISVVEFEQQYYSESDLMLFFQEMGIFGATTPIAVVGPNDQTNPGGEANLDIQWAMAMAPGAPMTFWSIGANSSVEIDDILTWAYAVGNVTTPPQVNSLSYGMTEANVDPYLGPGYVARSDVEFQKLALQGLTIIIADGDTGAGDLGGPPMGMAECTTLLHPDWPSQSPYITAVGSTYLTPNSAPECYLPASQGGADCSQGPVGEVGVALNYGIHWTTGGGFSAIQYQTPYQATVVDNYLNTPNVLPPASMFNSTGRAYPDVVTCGHNLMTALSGVFESIDGTSASAPIFAGLVTMWNDARIAAGKSALGFINPLLYELAQTTPDTFNDVVIGDNRCGGEGDGPCCPAAYKATVGWDAVTGLGSPVWSAVTQAILQMP